MLLVSHIHPADAVVIRRGRAALIRILNVFRHDRLEPLSLSTSVRFSSLAFTFVRQRSL